MSRPVGVGPFVALDTLLEVSATQGFDIRVKLDIASECCWACEFSYTPKPNAEDAPDRSFVLYAAGGATPGDVLARCLEAFAEWPDERKLRA